MNKMTSNDFETTYATQYNKLRRACNELFNAGGWDILGSNSKDDLADWLSCTTRVKYQIAKMYVDLYV